ncbi:dynein heavy chain 2, axonemal [Caerostris extrusa]|uniref:Dynein heavy chain 2, axonemal n=1 Tax=Caerostris extrusa TaxID=172846 RepID=A0AAV4QSP5_CAEEX|nr:dynein heavy chain 2, axonemal [Caerostris extrusa]
MLCGLAQIGAWGLFEDFNCIRQEIVSVLAQQITCITALAEKREIFSFVGSDIPLNPGCGIFLSSNPVFTMAKDQLSKQKHCEFGLKAIINFLKCMGNQKRLNPKWSDLEIIITTLRSTSLPKLDSSDARIFESILETALGTVKMASPEIPTTYTFNPKAYTLSELFGYFTDTGLWVDGLFSVILKEACTDLRTNERWIILNGPIDTSWIGSISSLLDNNEVLSTANGERIMLSPESGKSLDESLEEVTFIYDYNLDGNFEWAKWDSYLAETWKSDPGITFENLMVPTVASVSYQAIIELLLKEMKPVLLIGKSGCGKTIIAEDLLHKLKEEYLNYNVNFSPQISSLLLQQMLEKQLEKKAGGLLLPPSGQKMIVFLDDFDYGESDEFECHSSLELLYMAVDGAYFYNRQKWKLNILQNVCFIASASSPSEYHNKIPEPLFNRFNVINVLPPQEVIEKEFLIQLKDHYPSDRSLKNLHYLRIEKTYEEVKDIAIPRNYFENCIEEYKKAHDIVSHPIILFEYNINHLCRILKRNLWFFWGTCFF